MGITIDRKAAEKVFAKALTLARSSKPLPAEWLERTRKVAVARSKTFTPVLGNALLAKATNRRVDAFSLREGEGHRSYSARSLAKEVFVPACAGAGIDIRSAGAEPLNNQPFFHAERIAPDINVRENAREELVYLCECIERADFLENQKALQALAAFLRSRIEATGAVHKVELGTLRLSLADLERALDRFVAEDPEGGKTGQAIGAAILDLVFEDVRTRRVNDPGVKWPGDVGVFVTDKLLQSAEVKQRPATETEILLFAQRLQKAGVGRALILAFAQGKVPLDADGLRERAARLYDVDLGVFLKPSQLLREAVRWGRREVPVAMDALPKRGLARLAEIEASSARQGDWAKLLS